MSRIARIAFVIIGIGTAFAQSKPANSQPTSHPAPLVGSQAASLTPFQTVLSKPLFTEAADELTRSSFSIKESMFRGGGVPSDAFTCLIRKEAVIQRIRESNDARLLPALNEEACRLLSSLQCASFVIATDRKTPAGPIPWIASVDSSPTLVVPPIQAMKMPYDEEKTNFDTPKKRAGRFAQDELLPSLLESKLPSAKGFGYVAVPFVYGHGRASKPRETDKYETLLLLASIKDVAAFASRELTQEAFIKKSQVFLASEGPGFVRIELNLE